MNIVNKNKPQKSLGKTKKYLKLWHRRLGVLASLFVILLSVTGIALNHTDIFNLAHKPISNKWLLDHYGIKPPTNLRFYPTANVTVTDNLLWLDEHLLVEVSGTVIAVGKLRSFIVIVMTDQIYLYDEQGLLIDHLDTNFGVPRDIQQVYFKNDGLIVKTLQETWQVDGQFLSWHKIVLDNEPEWTFNTSISDNKVEKFTLYFRSQFLTVERIILDTHSGRIFGSIGVAIMDFAAITFILLAFSGLYLWMNNARKRR